MIKTSTTHYVTLKTFTHYGQPAIPIRAENGKLLCLAFMSRGDDHFVWVERSEVFEK